MNEEDIRRRRTRTAVSVGLSAFPAVVGLILFMMKGQERGELLTAFVALPLVIAVLDWILIRFTHKDRGNDEQSGKIMSMVYLICPVISFVSLFISSSVLYRMDMDTDRFLAVLFGFMFVFLGNELPKCRRNGTVGIKVKWTLEDDDNWRETHRFAGKCWVIGGFLLALTALLPGSGAVIGSVSILVLLAIAPVFYSWNHHRKALEKGTMRGKEQHGEERKGRKGTVFSILALVLIGVFVLIVLFLGKITYVLDDEGISVKANFYSDIRVEYDDIEYIEITDDFRGGSRVMGYGAPSMNCGTFRNEEFGRYTRYTMGGSDRVMVLIVDGEYVVLSGESDEETEALYREMLHRVR